MARAKRALAENPTTTGRGSMTQFPSRETNISCHFWISLAELERDTRPSLGFKSAKAKDLKAFEALEVAGQLVAAVAGWAINHEIGLAVEGLQFVPLQPPQTKSDPQYLTLKAAVNEHRHEAAGAATHGKRLDPFFLRTCLINLLRPNVGGYPNWLLVTTIDALDALEYGDTHPIFRRSGRKRRLGTKQRRLILKAIGAIHFRRKAYGMSDEQARFDVLGEHRSIFRHDKIMGAVT